MGCRILLHFNAGAAEPESLILIFDGNLRGLTLAADLSQWRRSPVACLDTRIAIPLASTVYLKLIRDQGFVKSRPRYNQDARQAN